MSLNTVSRRRVLKGLTRCVHVHYTPQEFKSSQVDCDIGITPVDKIIIQCHNISQYKDNFTTCCKIVWSIKVMSSAPMPLGTREAVVMLTNAEVREDPKRRRDLASRVYASALSGSLELEESSDITSFGELLMATLHDPWSEIRKDSAKSLEQWAQSLSPEFCLHALNLLLAHFDYADQWQVVHGNMLGITALKAHINGTDMLQRVKTYCLYALAHSTLLVRESARHCFSALFLQDHVMRELEALIELYVTQDNEAHSEAHSFSLQSFLDCLREYVSAKRAEFLEGVRSTSISSENVSSHGTRHPSKVLHVVDLCLEHTSSTVRFSAGTLLTSIFFACEDSRDCDIAAYVVEMICSGMLDISPEQWRRCEGFMIVAHDVLVASSNKYLHTLCNSAVGRLHESILVCGYTSIIRAVAPSQHDSLLQLIIAVYSALPAVVQHQSSFELRRIVAQLLPPLVRCGLFCAVYDQLSIGPEGLTSKSTELISLFGQLNNAAPIVLAVDFQHLIFAYCIAAEVAKTTKLITEAIKAANGSQSSNGSISEEAYSLTSINSRILSTREKIGNIVHAEVSWAMAVPRRLGEEDSRLNLWSAVSTTNTSIYFSQVCRVGQILLDIFEYRLLPQLYKNTLEFQKIKPERSLILSADVVEGILMCAGVCQCLGSDMDHGSHPEMSAALHYVVKLLCTTQLLLISDVTAPIISTAVEKFINTICGVFSSLADVEIEDDDMHVTMYVSSFTDPTGPAPYNTNAARARRGSLAAKYAQLDRWLCEAVSPVLSASARIFSESDLAVLLSVCIMWLERILSDPQWISIKATAKKSVLDFIAACIVRIEIIVSGQNGSIITNDMLHAIFKVSVPVLRLSFSRDDHSVSAQLVKLCRVTRTIIAIDRTETSTFSAFESIQEIIREYCASTSFDRSSTVSECSETKALSAEETAADIDDVKVLFHTSSKEDICDEITKEKEDSFSDWDESDDEDVSTFEINKGVTPQKILRKNSSIYLAEELDLFLKTV